MPTAVIFDVDGTLLDSVDQHARAWRDAFAEFGHDVPLDDIRRQIGKGGDTLLPVFLGAEEIERRGKQLEERRGVILKERYLPTIKAFPQVRALFERLRADGKRIVLASSAKEDELETYKTIAGISDLVETQTSSDDADSSKPNPDIFLAALKRLGDPSPDQCVTVGDTPYDAEAAVKAGIAVVSVLSGGFSEQSLREAGASAIYRDPADLLARYDDSPLA